MLGFIYEQINLEYVINSYPKSLTKRREKTLAYEFPINISTTHSFLFTTEKLSFNSCWPDPYTLEI